MTFATVNGARLRYEIAGPTDAPPVVLSNSLLTSLEMWDPQWDALTSRFRVLRYDTRGHGESEPTPAPYGMETLADDLAALMAHVRFDAAHIVGLSLGGMTAQMLAIRHPARTLSLCLVATTALRPSHGTAIWKDRIRTVRGEGNYDKLLHGIHDRWISVRFRRRQPEDFARLTEMITSTPIEGYVGCCEAIAGYDIRGRLGEVEAPTLVVVGEEDSGTPLEDAQIIADGIKDAQLEMIPYYRHMVNWEAQDEFDAILFQWLEQQTAVIKELVE